MACSPMRASLHLCFYVVLVSQLGCGATSTSRAVKGPDGKRWFAVTCRDEQSQCVAEATMRCPQGYRTSGSKEGAAREPAPESTSSATGPFTGTIMVRCNHFAVEGSFLECLGDESCPLGEKCVFPKDQGMLSSGTGRCQVPRIPEPSK
jgi:hypothetical protein